MSHQDHLLHSRYPHHRFDRQTGETKRIHLPLQRLNRQSQGLQADL